ncbi:MAG: 2-isopropylmalate synthase [Clostridia bacterium]|jgi:2-isopropylmalate synthase|nr:2-isopropylmalate synthase [Clostridia bacterium]MBT7121440.1 2-isopropylmalate synthase [Clostridia bacterium]
MKTIKIFDTTLRDGEQSPGCSMNLQEKIEVARQLEKLNVDVIEAGFAIASPGDFLSVQTVAQTIRNAKVASLSRALTKDIDRSYEALKDAVAPRIHTFIATSPIHMKYKLKMEPDDVLAQAIEMVTYAKSLCSDVEFSAEDASRTESEFLYRVIDGVIKAGATCVNIPDTVGYSTPDEYYNIISGVMSHVAGIEKVDVSVHCHNDLGLGVANSLAAIRAGATQVECTVNGIGERAGNAALEEVVMAVRTRHDIYECKTNVDTTQIYNSSRLVSTITGVSVQPNKAVVGKNAFAHEAGIHQHGVLANKETYEIMTPESIGLAENTIVLGKHSGKHGFAQRLNTLGYELDDKHLKRAFSQFIELADRKKEVTDMDLRALVETDSIDIPNEYEIDQFVITSGNKMTASAEMTLVHGGKQIKETSSGDGPVDAAFNAIERCIGTSFKLDDYIVRSVTSGKDAQGEVVVKLTTANNKKATGRGLSTDIVEASVRAYIDAINKYYYELKLEDR